MCLFQCASGNFWGPLGLLLPTTPPKTAWLNQNQNLLEGPVIHRTILLFCLSSTLDTSPLLWLSAQPNFVLSILLHLHPLPHFAKPGITIYNNTLQSFPSLSAVLKPEFNLKLPHCSNLLCQSYSPLLSSCSHTHTHTCVPTHSYTHTLAQ